MAECSGSRFEPLDKPIVEYGCILLGLFWLFLFLFRNNRIHGISIRKERQFWKRNTHGAGDLRTAMSAHARAAASDFPSRTRILSIPSKPYSFHSVHSAIGSRMNGMIFRSFRKRNSSQKNTNTVYSEYSFSRIVPKERTLYYYQENKNTRAKTQRDVKLLTAFLLEKNKQRKIEIQSEQLNRYVSEFILSVKRKDGQDYEPSSLRGLFSSFNRYLKERKYSASIIEDIVFDQARKCLEAPSKQLKKKRKR